MQIWQGTDLLPCHLVHIRYDLLGILLPADQLRSGIFCLLPAAVYKPAKVLCRLLKILLRDSFFKKQGQCQILTQKFRLAFVLQTGENFQDLPIIRM